MIDFLWNDSVLNWERKSANTSLITNTDFLYVNTIYTLNSIFIFCWEVIIELYCCGIIGLWKFNVESNSH